MKIIDSIINGKHYEHWFNGLKPFRVTADKNRDVRTWIKHGEKMGFGNDNGVSIFEWYLLKPR